MIASNENADFPVLVRYGFADRIGQFDDQRVKYRITDYGKQRIL